MRSGPAISRQDPNRQVRARGSRVSVFVYEELGVPYYNKDPVIWGTIFGFRIFGNSHEGHY